MDNRVSFSGVMVRGINPISSAVDAFALPNFTLQASQGVAFLDHSDVGNSSIFSLLCMTGLHEEGNVHIMGKDIKNLSPLEKANLKSNMGMIYDELMLVEDLSLYDNLLLTFAIQKKSAKESARRIGELLAWAELEQQSNWLPHQLNSSMYKMALIIRALCGLPQIIIANEPTAGLNEVQESRVLYLISNLPKLGISVLVTTGKSYVAERLGFSVLRFNTSMLHYHS